jgi:ketosteroid isomerase-like protein
LRPRTGRGGCTDPAEAGALQVVERYFAALTDPDAAAAGFGELLDPEIRFVEQPNALNPQGGERDRAAMLASFEQGRRLLAEQTIDVHDLLGVGEVVVTRATWTGTLAEPFGSFRAGARLRIHFAAFFTVRGGRIVRQENYDCYEPLPLGG